MPRCCSDPSEQDFAPCYSSVLVAGGGAEALRRAVVSMEEDEKICPCVTAWCSKCKRVSTLVTSRGLYKTRSEHLAHMLVMRRGIEASLKSCPE
jgi:hypothetical protein